MSFLDRLFGRDKPDYMTADQVFQLFTAYRPVWTNWSGKIYESELVRAAVDAKARHVSKLKVDFMGAARPALKTKMAVRPNNFQSWSQFLYRTSTILDMQNTCFIAPMLDRYGEIQGYTTLLPSMCEIREYDGTLWVLYRFKHRGTGAIEFDKIGILTKFQYHDEFFGDDNGALTNTMKLLDIQSQGIREAVKTAGNFRFIGRATNFTDPKDLKELQQNFNESNLAADASGALFFPNTIDSIQQVRNDSFTISADQQALIQKNVNNYFGANEAIMQNRATGEEMDAFFNGAVEPFSIQLSEIMTNMTYTQKEQAFGSKIMVTANRLQYMPVAQKIQLARQMGDRGILTINEIRDLFNYAPVEDGDRATIRGEYYFTNDDKEVTGDDEN